MALAGSGLTRFIRRDLREEGRLGLPEIFAALPTPVLALDAGGVVVEANPAAETYINLARSAIVGQNIAELIGHPLTSVSSDARFVAYDLDLTLPGDKLQSADLSVAPLPDRPGWRMLTIHPHPQVTVRTRRTGREGGTLAAVGAAALLAHEIKNPLSGIRGAAQLLESAADEGSRDLTRLIRDEVDRVAALIDRMEGFTDSRAIAVEPFNIHTALYHARDVAIKGFARDFSIRELYDPSLPHVLGHRDSLVQVVINLLKNAVEAMKGAGMETGTITLTTAYRHGVRLLTDQGDGRRSLPIELSVSDEGPGAPDSIRDHLFDPFVSSKRSSGGLGLALVEKLIADQGGMVEYVREGQPPRTIFRVLLPRAVRGE
ncbi:ATP-binding protein [Sphingomonas naphthae]|uniref:histidine kinase n=1 Tax=Sphingomonas naphthae TaxID=1813468 RepID=A0ABY7TRQ1_9SPHN|nr:ATP-binding protein [Sphingomonas naphthae]WCT74879.1 ATP-binding protein [Sphingomonas naphthae]